MVDPEIVKNISDSAGEVLRRSADVAVAVFAVATAGVGVVFAGILHNGLNQFDDALAPLDFDEPQEDW